MFSLTSLPVLPTQTTTFGITLASLDYIAASHIPTYSTPTAHSTYMYACMHSFKPWICTFVWKLLFIKVDLWKWKTTVHSFPHFFPLHFFPPCVVLHLGCAVFIHEVEEIMKSVLFITLLKFHCYYSRGILNIGGIVVYLRDFVSSFIWAEKGWFFLGGWGCWDTLSKRTIQH